LHEQNAVAGLANRVLAYGADRILTGFPGAFGSRSSRKADWVGNPVRAPFTSIEPPEVRFAARTGPLALLVVGGSLGAAGLNERVPKALALIPRPSRPRVVHQAGERHIDALRAAYRDAGVEAECVAFIDDIATRYAEADLVVCRGGATTVAELAAVGVAAIVVPLPGAIADEQSANARFLVDAGAAVMVPQRELTPEALAARIESCTRESLLAMAVAARRVARPDAADRVADACIALGTPR
jgi:UDP-N-acetylglucosamine--N-acetylmuramyl-(pentapeptide) pyrophosphoryl-undecaprenol N-acetylglucosamine transferase